MGGTTSLFSTVEAALLPSAPTAQAYLTIPGIPGDVILKGLEGRIEVLDWTFGLTGSAPARGGGAGAGKVAAKDLVVVLPTGKATPPLVHAVATGQHLQVVTLDVWRRQASGGTGGAGKLVKFFTAEFEDVLVVACDAAAHPVTAVPLDVVRFAYGRLKVTVRPEDPKGTVGKPVETQVDFVRLNA